MWSKASTADVQVAHAEAHQLQEVLVLGRCTRKALSTSSLLKNLEVTLRLLVHFGRKADLRLLRSSGGSKARHVGEGLAVRTRLAEEEVHAPPDHACPQQELSGLWAKRGESGQELEIMWHGQNEVFELVEMGDQQQDEISKGTYAGLWAWLSRT